jgi:hypothetical protein
VQLNGRFQCVVKGGKGLAVIRGPSSVVVVVLNVVDGRDVGVRAVAVEPGAMEKVEIVLDDGTVRDIASERH